MEYLEDCEGTEVDIATIDYEKFLGFLDNEHYLGLKGKDTWSDQGNESQLMVRHAIVKVLHERTPTSPPVLYRRFVKSLNLTDYVITFNYDTLLESALEAEGIPYRLFPMRFSEVGWGYNTVDNSRDEVVVIKLHGSIDWCDRSYYENQVKRYESLPVSIPDRHPIFGNERIVASRRLTEGPRSEDDPLKNIYRVTDVGDLVPLEFWKWCPLILPPSHAKLFYAETLRGLWWGIQRDGGYTLSLCVVGYSLPTHDEYVRQAFYSIFKNYTDFADDMKILDHTKTPLRILDRANKGDSGADIRARYRFANWCHVDLKLGGFSESTLPWLMS